MTEHNSEPDMKGEGALSTPAATPAETDAGPDQSEANLPLLMRRPSTPFLILGAVLLVALAAAAAYFVDDQGDEIFGGRVEILYEDLESPSDTEIDRNLATQQALLESRGLLASVASDNSVSPELLEDRLSVDLGPDNILTVTVGSETPEGAEALAEDISVEYLKIAEKGASDSVQAVTQPISNRIDQLTDDLADAPAVDQTLIQQRIIALEARSADLEAESQAVKRVEIITPPYTLDDPLEPQPVRSVVAGGLAGGILASIIVGSILWYRRV